MPDIFVFGSNTAGRHGRGSALAAVQYWGAQYGVGVGRKGNSYAIPTKDRLLNVLPLECIARHVTDFLAHARMNPNDRFNVVAIGCGLAGYKPEQIGPLFRGSPANVILPPEFMPYA